jgi:hypothetical protein
MREMCASAQTTEEEIYQTGERDDVYEQRDQ